jgi:hypothetical protein
MKKLTAYCINWHLQNSDAFKDLLEVPLKSIALINFVGWDGENLPDNPNKDSLLVFCMLPPTEQIIKMGFINLVWIPMWDQAQGYSDEWWSALPKHLKVVAFSEVIDIKAKQAGLRTIRLQHFKNPQDYKPASWKNGHIAYYWNRVGMIGPEFLERFCETANITELIFNPDTDPGTEENKFYSLPSVLGKTTVTTIHRTKSREDALRQIEHANIVISPRLTEGAGMVFQESMARGCTVIAHNAPTMNEYIQNNVNGILLKDGWYSLADRYKNKLGISKHQRTDPFLLEMTIDWKVIKNAKFEKLGIEAARYTKAGYENWVQETSRFAEFMNLQ